MSVRAFASKSGIAASSINRWLTLDSPDEIYPRSFENLADGCGMTVGQLDAYLAEAMGAIPAGSPDPEADLAVLRLGAERIAAALDRKRRLGRTTSAKAG